MGKKLGRNDKCHCNSGKKYKKCCLVKDDMTKMDKHDQFSNGHEISSDKVQIVVDQLLEEYPDHKVIDITNILETGTYKPIQTKNYFENIIMVVERNEKNEEVFSTRGPDNVNMMVLYRGAFQCFEDINFQFALDKIYGMINKRLNGDEI